ncbi:MAG: hypothetical protein KGP12_11985 [Actinomycetales bacterium]|nr:hypothetical protein [Actinomycetales bacterium]
MIRGYVDTLEAVPGQVVRLHARGVAQATAAVWRWQHGDPHPAGPGVIAYPCDWGAGEFSAPDEGAEPGSYASARVDASPAAGMTICAWARPTDLSHRAFVLSWAEPGSSRRAGLAVVDGMLALADATGEPRLTGQRIRERAWHFIGAAWRPDGSVDVFSAPWGRTGGPFVQGFDALAGGPTSAQRPELGTTGIDLAIGAGLDLANGAFDGTVTGLQVHGRALDIVELMDIMNGYGPAPAHAWDFADRTDSDSIPGVGGSTPALRLHQAPAFSGEYPAPVETNGHLLTPAGSIHFHRDDLEDCRWPVVHAVDIPADAQAGFYGIRVQSQGEVLDIPFVVQRPARVSLLASTLTWQAYGNLGRDPDTWPGRSHYSLHADGSPVIITTARRPCPTFGPQARLEVDGGDGFAVGDLPAHLLTADLYAWHWLVQDGRAPGVVGDRALHEQGSAALAGVDVLILSAHPEYWTSRMLDALAAFLDRGGNVIYLGGNGLYWVTSLHPAKPHLMEVRRWGGSQTCSVEPADRLHQYESCLGGLWAEQGRPPNALVGVGFAGFGAGASMTFTRTDASHAPDWDWAFAGVAGEEFGSEGINTGPGNEFDQWDASLPTPGQTTILATSTPSTPDHFGVFEHGPARAPDPSLRADLAVTRTPAGGLVLAVSSITASGCLVVEGPTAGLRRVCSNVLDRMLTGRA